MDDEFFASVLKKWANSSQEVVDLKRRLGEVERERNEYRQEASHLKEEERKKVQRQSFASTTCDDAEILDLDDVGDKLEKARCEYQRRLKELNDARNREETLKREVEEFKRERTQLRSQAQANRTQCTAMSSELSSLRYEKGMMTDEISNLKERLEQAEKDKTELQTRNPEIDDMDIQQMVKLQEQMTSLEKQLQDLQTLAQTLEMENAVLRYDLAATRESLQKTKDSNKSLRMTIGNLSRIARNVTGATDVPSSTYQDNSSVRTSAEVPLPPPLEVVKPDPVAKQELKVDVDLSFNDETIVAEPNEHLTHISSHRLEALASRPAIIPDIDINEADNKFTRSFTSAATGRSIQSLIVRVTSSGTNLARGRNIEEYLCPRLDHNPWCPSTPGQHGYMFVGLGREKNTYTIPQLRNLFVGLPKHNNREERYFRYLGVYRVCRVEPLTVDEWGPLKDAVKQSYAQVTKVKNKDSRTIDAILAAYESGELAIPCVQLECVGFDEELYAGLLEFRFKHKSAQQGRSPKRIRENDHEGNTPQRSKRVAQ